MNITIPGSTWGDVFVDRPNRIGCVYDSGLDIIVDFYAIENETLRKKDSVHFSFTEKVLFARGDRANNGDILVMGQGASTGKFRIKSRGGNYDPPVPLTTFGTHVCDLIPTLHGFYYAVQVTNNTYYDSNTMAKHIIGELPEGTSQGMIQLTDDGIHWSDIWRQVIPQMLYPFIQGDIAIGEGATDPAHIQALEGNQQKNIFWGIAERPRSCYDVVSNIFVVASRSGHGVTFNFFRKPLINLTVVTEPIPDPKPEPKPMELAEKVKVTLRRFFTKFPLTRGEENIRQQCIRAAEQVAFEHPRDNYGTKRADSGRPVTKDGISQKEGNTIHAWDIVVGAGTNNPKLNLDNPQYHNVSDQVFIGVGDDLDNGEVFDPQNYLGGVIVEPEPEPEPNPEPVDCTPIVPGHDTIKLSMEALRAFCQTYEFNGNKPYVNDEIHDNGLFVADGLLYFMLSDTGNWAKILMNPADKRSWDEKRQSADLALQTYMKRRVGDNS